MEAQESLFPNLPPRLIGLGELAENLWWSWHPAARMLYKRLDRRAWKESLHNPDKMLRELPKEILESAAKDPDYLRQHDEVILEFQHEIGEQCCLLDAMGNPNIHAIAYFSAEYGLHHSLPFYAGGLGFEVNIHADSFLGEFCMHRNLGPGKVQGGRYGETKRDECS